MEDLDKNGNPFSVKKTFGLSVLLELTEKSTSGLKIEDDGARLSSNLPEAQLKNAVGQVIKNYNINLKSE